MKWWKVGKQHPPLPPTSLSRYLSLMDSLSWKWNSLLASLQRTTERHFGRIVGRNNFVVWSTGALIILLKIAGILRSAETLTFNCARRHLTVREGRREFHFITQSENLLKSVGLDILRWVTQYCLETTGCHIWSWKRLLLRFSQLMEQQVQGSPYCYRN